MVLRLRLPIVVLVLAATAVPVQVRPLGVQRFDVTLRGLDIVANVLGYLPVGIVLSGLGPVTALGAAAVMSLTAEIGQLVMVHRFPSLVDLAANIGGALVGIAVAARWRLGAPALPVDRRLGIVAATVALILLAVGAWVTAGDAANGRGLDAPGILEGHWTLDDTGGQVAADATGHALHGRLMNGASFVPGKNGQGVRLDGADDYVDLGRPVLLRLTGSTSITAWIKASRFPTDDAVIVANRDGRPAGTNRGFQFDTNADLGVRTLGLSIADSGGTRVFRFGATPLVADTWYHAAAVYDAAARTMDVYLDGRLDNGVLTGPVPACQGKPVLGLAIGRRPGAAGYEFAGVVDDVRIYSRPLTAAEIRQLMQGPAVAAADQRAGSTAATASSAGHDGGALIDRTDRMCGQASSLDADLRPGVAVAVGALAAFAAASIRPRRGPARPTVTVVALAAGLLLVACIVGLWFLAGGRPTAPGHDVWMIPLLSVLGGASVAASLTDDVARHSAQSPSP